jgi:hypothetical protein
MSVRKKQGLSTGRVTSGFARTYPHKAALDLIASAIEVAGLRSALCQRWR